MCTTKLTRCATRFLGAKLTRWSVLLYQFSKSAETYGVRCAEVNVCRVAPTVGQSEACESESTTCVAGSVCFETLAPSIRIDFQDATYEGTRSSSCVKTGTTPPPLEKNWASPISQRQDNRPTLHTLHANARQDQLDAHTADPRTSAEHAECGTSSVHRRSWTCGFSTADRGSRISIARCRTAASAGWGWACIGLGCTANLLNVNAIQGWGGRQLTVGNLPRSSETHLDSNGQESGNRQQAGRVVGRHGSGHELELRSRGIVQCIT